MAAEEEGGEEEEKEEEEEPPPPPPHAGAATVVAERKKDVGAARQGAGCTPTYSTAAPSALGVGISAPSRPLTSSACASLGAP
jgi:hypothetical protein